ncbi:hypothetical protein D3C77_476660 [compost metagenome]
MNLPNILEKVNPYVDTNLSVNDMWKLATIAYDGTMTASEQIPPMSLLIEQNVGGAQVLGVRSEDELKAYVQEQLNKTQDITQVQDATDENNKTGDNQGTSTNTDGKAKNSNGATSSSEP